jgi:hypothetical protein
MLIRCSFAFVFHGVPGQVQGHEIRRKIKKGSE